MKHLTLKSSLALCAILATTAMLSAEPTTIIQGTKCDLNNDGKLEAIQFIPTPVNGKMADSDSYKYSIVVKDENNKIIWTNPEDGEDACNLYLNLNAQSWEAVTGGDIDADGNAEVCLSISPSDVSPFRIFIMRWDEEKQSLGCFNSAYLIERKLGSDNFTWANHFNDDPEQIMLHTSANEFAWRGRIDAAADKWKPDFGNMTWISSIDSVTSPGIVKATAWRLRNGSKVQKGKAILEATGQGYKVTKWVTALAAPTTQTNAEGVSENEGVPDVEVFVAKYRAVLAPRDRVNSNGKKLESIGAVLAQDRANFHKFGIRQRGDETDSGYFKSAENRQKLMYMTVNSTRLGREAMRANKPVTITVYKDRILIDDPN
ncbi:hypothetical protein GX645_07110 [Candidatus Sumerlaeota bacterium]|nr:hypothetical protein [Candidatus Sumerlaeota bacterium]